MDDTRLLQQARSSLRVQLREELPKLSDGWDQRVTTTHPAAATLCALAEALMEAGFTLHDCAARSSLGGVCLTPSTHDKGVVVTWATHDALARDPRRAGQGTDVHDLMNYALADVLTALGWDVASYGHSTAHLVRGRLDRPAAS